MLRTCTRILLLTLVAAVVAGCVASASRPPRPDLATPPPTTLAPSATAPAAPSVEARVTVMATATVPPEPTAVAPPPASPVPSGSAGVYPPPAVPSPYPEPRDTTLFPMVARPAPDGPSAAGIPAISAVVPAGFVQARGASLVLDGEPYYFLGVNASYLMSEYFPERAIEPIIRYLAETGGVNVIRLFYQPGKDPARFERILDLGGQYGIRFIVALQDFYFYKTQTWFDVHYKDEDLPHIRAVVPRFRDRPEILMWELMNEPGCAEGDDPKQCQQHIYNWAAAVSAEIKALDPHHLVSIGAMSAEGTRYHRSNYEDMHELPTVDVISLHRYVGKTSRTEMRLAAKLNKPIYVGEGWEKAYKKDRCQPIDGSILAERAEKIREDLEWSFEHGLDGYLLWQHDPGLVEKEDGDRQWYCSEFSLLEGDPTYDVLRAFMAQLRTGACVDDKPVEDD